MIVMMAMVMIVVMLLMVMVMIVVVIVVKVVVLEVLVEFVMVTVIKFHILHPLPPRHFHPGASHQLLGHKQSTAATADGRQLSTCGGGR